MSIPMKNLADIFYTATLSKFLFVRVFFNASILKLQLGNGKMAIEVKCSKTVLQRTERFTNPYFP